MARMFLRGPLCINFSDEDFAGAPLKEILQPGRGAAEARVQIRKKFELD